MKTNEYLQFFAWGGHTDLLEVEHLLKGKQIRVIEFISPEEWAPVGGITDVLYEYVENNPCELRMLLNAYDKWQNPMLRPPRHNVTYEDNPTLILNYVMVNYFNDTVNNYNFANGNNLQDYNPSAKSRLFKYNLVSMTNRVYSWRADMIDYFEEYGIINPKNCIIWQNNGQLEHPYRHFKPRPITREPFINSNGAFNSFNLPADYSSSWFAAVAESTMDIITLTEKAVTPALFMKPFIILGCKGYHRFLESIGFKLFDELIDYTFDLEDNDARRIEMFARQVQKVSDLNPDDVTYYNNLFHDKLIHNKRNLFKLYHGKENAPKYTTGWKLLGQKPEYTYHKELNAQINWYQHVQARGWNDNF